jgi:hypothetical protein
MREIRRVLLALKAPHSAWRYDLNEQGYKAARKAQPYLYYGDNPQEVFTVEIARAAAKAQRFLARRRLTRVDREDIIQEALLWCWEHRDSYSGATSLDTWFVNAVRDAFKQWRRDEFRTGHIDSEEE